MFNKNNDLRKYFDQNQQRLIHKLDHYFEAYDAHFQRYRGTEVVLMEIGCYHGGSLQMWRDYFGPKARIIGVDIDERCKQYEQDGFEIYIGDQGDEHFLKHLRASVPRLDILIDDGGHRMEQQIRTFNILFPHVKEDGIFLCEDLVTSYWPAYGGGYKKPNTFIELSKHLIDALNAYHSTDLSQLKPSPFTQMTHSLHFYDAMLFIEKRPHTKPVHRMTGKRTFPEGQDPNGRPRPPSVASEV